MKQDPAYELAEYFYLKPQPLIDTPEKYVLCPFCSMPTQIVWVHGHGQCMYCKTNFDECCRGENTDLNFSLPEKQEPDTKNENDEEKK